MGDPVSRDIRTGARALAADAAAARLVPAFAAAGIDVLVLRGPAIAAALYDPGEVRAYADVDLLVPAQRWEDARALLTARGLTPALAPEAIPDGLVDHAETWDWPAAGTSIDLHRRAEGLPTGAAWEVLATGSQTIAVAGAAVPVPGPAGVALVVALHAAQHGASDARLMDDLARAVRRLDEDTWRDALARARSAGAERLLAAGLSLRPEGRELAARIGAQATGLTAAERLRLGAVPDGAFTLAHLGTLSWSARPAYVARKVVPTAAFMRVTWPLARRGRLGLAAAYVQRLGWMCLQAPPALRAWRRARRRR